MFTAACHLEENTMNKIKGGVLLDGHSEKAWEGRIWTVNKAFKYAGTAIYVSFWEDAAGIGIRVRDEGAGVPEDELTKITEKFYRGSNAAKESGSGLGLYLAKLFMDKMQGQMNFYNDNGFVVELYLRKV